MPWLPFRPGLDELRFVGLFFAMAGILIVLMIAAAIAMFVLTMIAGLVFGGLIAAQTAPTDSSAAWLVAGFGLLTYIPILYAMGRFAVSFPLTIKQKRFTLSGWSASKGQGWSLFFAHIVIYALALAVQVGLSWEYMSSTFLQATNPQAMIPAEQLAAQMANPFGGLMIIAAPIQAVMMLLILGPTAAIAAKAEG